MKLSLIIPAYNEAERIGNTLERIQEYFSLNPIEHEVIVVDDGSKDDTIKICESFNVRVIPLSKNMGKGAAVRTGILESKGDLKIFTDADLSTPIEEIEKMIPILESDEYEVCIGSRALQQELIRKHQPWYREAMGKTFNKFVQLLVVKGITDTQCGFKGFTKKAAEKIFNKAQVNGFAFDVEVVYLAKRLGFKIKELPVEWINDERSKVHPVFDSIRMLNEIVKIRMNNYN